MIMKRLSSIKSLVNQTVKIYRQKYWEFVELCFLAIVGAVPLVIIYAVHYLLNYSNDAGQYQVLNLLLAVLYFLATMLAAYFALSAVIGFYLIANDDKRISAWQIILSTRHYFWHFLLVWVLIEALLMLASAPLVVFLQVSAESWLPILAQSGQAFDWRLLVGLVLLLAPIVWVGVNCFWSFFALMEGGLQNISALRRSRELVRGRSLAVFAKLAAFVGIWVLFYGLISIHNYWPSNNAVYVAWDLLMKLVLVASNFVFVPSLVIFGRVMYKELVAMAPKTKLAKAGNPTLVKFAILCAGLFALSMLMTTIKAMSSEAVMQNKLISRDRQRVADMKKIQSLLADYYKDQGAYPEWLVMGQELAVAGTRYAEALPSNIKSADGDCPVDYEYGYYQVAGGQDYVLTYCLGAGLVASEGDLLSAGEHKLSQDDIIW